MIILADSNRIIAAAGRKAELIGRPMNIPVVDGGGPRDRARKYRLIGACLALFAGPALFGQTALFQGSVPTGVASSTPLSLTLRDAIDRGLRTNLGVLLSAQVSEAARGGR